MEFILITNDPAMALHAQECGVHRIMVDLELIGKDARQGHLNTVISGHTTDDVHTIGKVLSRSKLQVRVNPLHEGSENEIDTVIGLGADIVMLPMFTTANEAQRFVSMVGGRAKTQLLVETPQALVRIDDVVAVPGVDEIYIGLNDLHLGMGLRFMFELLSGGIIEYLAGKINKAGIRFGFGGIARLGQGMVDSSLILAEHFRLNSQMVILSRDFHAHAKNYLDLARNMDLKQEVLKLSVYLNSLPQKDSVFFAENKELIKKKVNQIVYNQPMTE